VVGIWRYGTFW